MRQYPHMCRDEHQEIGHSDSEHERCPLCRAIDRASEAERVCAELYQVIGSIADHAGLFDHPDVIRALDQASQARIVHYDLLPWPREALTK